MLKPNLHLKLQACLTMYVLPFSLHQALEGYNKLRNHCLVAELYFLTFEHKKVYKVNTFIYIYILTLSAFYINVNFILTIQGDIFFKSVIFRILRIFNGSLKIRKIRYITDLKKMYRQIDRQRDRLPQSHCGDNQEGTLFSW